MLKIGNQKIEAMFELFYNEIRIENNEMMKLEKSQRVKIDKSNLIELIRDMEISLRISRECIEKGEIIADRYPEGYFSSKRYSDKKKEKEKEIKESKNRKENNK